MTVSIIIPNSSFDKWKRRVKLPYIEDASRYYLFGGSAAASLVDHSLNRATTASAIGTPTYGVGHALIGAARGFDTGIITGRPFTYIAVANGSGATSPVGLVGQWNQNSAKYLNQLEINLTSLQARLAVEGNYRATRAGVPVSGYCFYAGSFGGTQAAVYAHDGTTLLSASGSHTATQTADINLRIGATNTGGDGVRIAAAVAFTRVLSAAEITEVYTYLKGFLTTRGISVI